MFGTITGSKITNCQFNATLNKVQRFYGLSNSIANTQIKIMNSLTNFQIQNATEFGFSLAYKIIGNIFMNYYADCSQIKSKQVSMSSEIYQNFLVFNSKFYQQFQSENEASLFTLTLKAQGQQYGNVELSDCIIRATVSSTLQNYAFIGAQDDGTSATFSNLQGYVNGLYQYLTEDQSADYIFNFETSKIDGNNESNVLIDDNINVNNTKFQMNLATISQTGNDVTLFSSSRTIFYGFTIENTQIQVTANQFSFIANTITRQITLQNVVFNATVNVTGTKFASIAFELNIPLTIKNCTFGGNINCTGSVYLLFETTKKLIKLENISTIGEISFSQDSYGLIKTVQQGISINTLNSGLTMQINGNTMVTSSLMFDQVSQNNQNQIRDVTGYYGGYISNQLCSSSTCQISNVEINLGIRNVTGASLVSGDNYQFEGNTYYVYQVSQSYLGKLNGTNVTVDQRYVSNSYTLVSILGDPQIIQNTEVHANITSSCYSKCTVGGIAGISRQTNYTIQNVTIGINYTHSSTYGQGNVSDFFGILNVPVSMVNVTSCGQLSGSVTVGGIVALLSGVKITMQNVNIKGEYKSTSSYVGGVIGQIEQNSETILNNLIFNGLIVSSSAGSSPIYGRNQGTITQLTVNSIQLEYGSVYNDCPVGMGTTISVSQCPEKSPDKNFIVNDFTRMENVSGYQSSSYSYYTFYYNFDKEMDLNNSNIYVTLPTSFNQLSKNISLFGIVSKYDNINITIVNEPNCSMGTDQYGFSILQSLITNETLEIKNIRIEGKLYGRNYGRFASISLQQSSNATLTNISVTLPNQYFYYSSGLVTKLYAPQIIYKNILINATGNGTAQNYLQGIAEEANSTLVDLQVINATFILNQTKSASIKGFANRLSASTSAQYTFKDINMSYDLQSYGSSYPCISSINGSQLIINNSRFNVFVNYTSSSSALFENNYISGQTNITNTNFTGTVQCSSSYSNTYFFATVEGNVQYGQRNIINCSIDNQTVVSRTNIGGLIGSVSKATTIEIDNTSVKVSLELTGQNSSSFAGGFIGSISVSGVNVTLQNSLFENIANLDIASCLVSNSSAYKYTAGDNVTCPIEGMQTIQIISAPTYVSQKYSSQAYNKGKSACYWEELNGQTDLNGTTIDFDLSEQNEQCGWSGTSAVSGTLLSILGPDFTPSIVKNVKTQGSIKLAAYWPSMVVFMHGNNQNEPSTISNVVLNHTNLENFKGSDQFNTFGFMFRISTQSVEFVKCVSGFHHNHTLGTWSSYAVGFTSELKSTVTFTSCTSNFTVAEASSGSTTKYAIYQTKTGSCSKTEFTTTYSDQC